MSKSYGEQLIKMKNTSGYKEKLFVLETGKSKLKINLYGPDNFLASMPPLFKKVANARYTTRMLEAISRANKPLSCIYTKDRRQLGGGRLYVEQTWYEKLLLETKEVK